MNTKFICNGGDIMPLALSAGNQTISGEFMVTDYNMDIHSDVINITDSRQVGSALVQGMQWCELNLRLKSTGEVTIGELPKRLIRNKKVDDCSIQELLFAVRKKIKQ